MVSNFPLLTIPTNGLSTPRLTLDNLRDMGELADMPLQIPFTDALELLEEFKDDDESFARLVKPILDSGRTVYLSADPVFGKGRSALQKVKGEVKIMVSTQHGKRILCPNQLIRLADILKAKWIDSPAVENVKPKLFEEAKESFFSLHSTISCALASRKQLVGCSVSLPSSLLCKTDKQPEGLTFIGQGYKGQTIDEFISSIQSCPSSSGVRFSLCPSSLLGLLSAVFLGVDVISCAYPWEAAEEGVLLNWRLPDQEGEASCKRARKEEGIEQLLKDAASSSVITSEMNLREEKFRFSKTPLPGLAYSESYLHHLLRCGELLGPQLLATKNIEICCRLMEEARKAKCAQGGVERWLGSLMELNFKQKEVDEGQN